MSPLSREDRAGAKWDRAARYLKIATILHAHPEGISVPALAGQVGVSKRTLYRDLAAMERDAELPLWNDGGRWGLAQGAFLPALSLTLHEAMTLFLAARVLVKTSDEQDTELVGAFVKLASVLPPVLAAHVQATMDVFARTPPNPTFTRVYRILAEAWANRRVVEIEYDAGVYEPERRSRRTRVRPFAIEPSALTHALYLIGWDEQRGARRTFKVERIRSASLTPDRFEAGDDGDAAAVELSRAWDVISDQPLETIVIRFSQAVARRVAETRWHASQVLDPQPDGSLIWRGRVSGTHEILIWILGWGPDAEVLEPESLRDAVSEQHRRAAELYA